MDVYVYHLVCRRKVDLTFVIDHSDSVGADNFRLVKRFVSRTMENFNVGADQTRVSVVCFGTQANVEWTFKDYPGQNMKAANDALTQIRFTGGASRLDLALDLANEGIYNTRNGMRQYAFKVIKCGILFFLFPLSVVRSPIDYGTSVIVVRGVLV